MFDRLRERAFEIDFSISRGSNSLASTSRKSLSSLKTCCSSTIPIEEIIGSGGGETKAQRLRNALAADWRKHNFVVQRIIDGVEREADRMRSIISGPSKQGCSPLRLSGTIRTHSSIAIWKTLSAYMPTVQFHWVLSSPVVAHSKVQ
ncbi:hypothetical protein LJR220_004009 [Bradyrhizobium sp. LjRoot220]